MPSPAPAPSTKGAGDGAQLWRASLERLADRVAHEIKNPLNGAAINAEVVRSRLERTGTRVEEVSPFAAAVIGELGRAIELVDALLMLTRPIAASIDLMTIVKPLVVLHCALLAHEGGSIVAERRGVEDGSTEVDGEVARLVVSAALEQMARGGVVVRCLLERRGGEVAIEMTGAPQAVTLPSGVRASIEAAGGRAESTAGGITLSFIARERAVPERS